MIYFDNAATTPIDSTVVDLIGDILREQYGNPSSIHQLGRRAKNIIEQSRKSIAENLGVSPSEIIFTSGGTESNNMAIRSAVKKYNIERIITSPIEHPCVRNTITRCSEKNVAIEHIKLNKDGEYDMAHLSTLLTQNTGRTLISLMHANNEIGTINDLAQIGELAKENNAMMHSDMVQTIGHYDLNLSDLPVDFASASAHKFHGPKGVGLLYVSGDFPLDALIEGGGQERNLRSGTENVAYIAAMAKALEIYMFDLETRSTYIRGLKTYMRTALSAQIPTIQFNGKQDEQALYTVLSVSLPKTQMSDLILERLDIEGVCCSAGSACSSGTSVESEVIKFLRGENDPFKTLRFSFSHQNTEEEIDVVVKKLVEFSKQ